MANTILKDVDTVLQEERHSDNTFKTIAKKTLAVQNVESKLEKINQEELLKEAVSDAVQDVDNITSHSVQSNTSNIAEQVLTSVSKMKPDKALLCETSWLPRAFSLNIHMIAFVFVFIVVFIANSNRKAIRGNNQFLMVLPIIISFSGNVGVGVLTRTLLLWNDVCFHSTKSKIYWFFQQITRGIIIALVVSIISFLLLNLLHFDNRVIEATIMTIIITICSSSALGVAYPLILRLFSTQAPQLSGTILLISNDILSTYIYFAVVRTVMSRSFPFKAFRGFIKHLQNIKIYK